MECSRLLLILGECWIPIAFGLLPDKKRDSYDTFFGLVKTALTSNNLELSARTVMSDFEVSMKIQLIIF